MGVSLDVSPIGPAPPHVPDRDGDADPPLLKFQHPRSHGRRIGGAFLDISMDLHWVRLRHVFVGRDGLDVGCKQFAVFVFFLTRARRAPISGGQYHWVSEFAPPQHQRFLSYITGTVPTFRITPVNSQNVGIS